MPAAASGPQIEQKPVQFTDAQVAALATYVASLGPGPGHPRLGVPAGQRRRRSRRRAVPHQLRHVPQRGRRRRRAHRGQVRARRSAA